MDPMDPSDESARRENHQENYHDAGDRDDDHDDQDDDHGDHDDDNDYHDDADAGGYHDRHVYDIDDRSVFNTKNFFAFKTFTTESKAIKFLKITTIFHWSDITFPLPN